MHASSRPASAVRAAIAAAVILALGGGVEAGAPPRFSAAYAISFLGLPVGEATLAVEHAEGRYALDLSAGLRGVAGFFVDGAGSAQVAGTRGRAGAISATFRIDSRYAGKPIRVVLPIDAGRAGEATVEPAPTPRPDRVPVTAQDRAGIVDPLSMLVVPLAPAPLAPGLCERRIPVFDGVTRADLVLSQGRMEQAAEDAYRGPVLVCRVRWVPIAGHRANGPNVRRMALNEAMEVRLAPALDGAVLLPLAISVATGWGTVRIAATRWGGDARTEPVAGRASVRVSLPRAR